MTSLKLFSGYCKTPRCLWTLHFIQSALFCRAAAFGWDPQPRTLVAGMGEPRWQRPMLSAPLTSSEFVAHPETRLPGPTLQTSWCPDCAVQTELQPPLAVWKLFMIQPATKAMLLEKRADPRIIDDHGRTATLLDSAAVHISIVIEGAFFHS